MTKITIIRGNCLKELPKIPSESVDLILTDPPYGIEKKEIKGDESQDTFKLFLPEALRVLKNNSFFITFIPIGLVRETLQFISKYFNYVWLYVVYYANMQRITHSPIGFSKFSLVGIFSKGNAKKHKKIPDVLKFVYGREAYVYGHPSAKPETSIKKLIEMASDENDIILDPFLGSGTTAVVCKMLNRSCIGIEINSEYVKLAQKRLNEVPRRLDKFAYKGKRAMR